MTGLAAQPFPGDYDYIIVGAGSAGCVVANRLSANPGRRVLLLEAGGRDNWIWYHIPVGYLFAIGNPRADWMFQTTPQPGLHGRALAYPRGKVLGGSSAINAMITMRGQAEDYDAWRDLGLPGWGWRDVLPVFRGIEDHFLGESNVHGSGGEWRVEPPRVRWEILDAVRNAAQEMGVPKTADFNTGNNEGSGYFHVNQKAGRRWSAARGFLGPARRRPNLRTETGALVETLTLEGRLATGLVFRQNGQRFTVKANAEIILCAGAIGSPQILQRSGLGPEPVLAAAGVTPILDIPGIGANLQDHLQQRAIYQVSGTETLNQTYYSVYGKMKMGLDYALRRRGPLTMAPSQLGIFTRSDEHQARPNIQFHVQPLSLDRFGEPLHRFPAITVAACNLRPTSRGSVRITSADPEAPPEINPNYLATEEDRRVAGDAIRVTRRLMQQPALARFHPRERVPGEASKDCAVSDLAGDIGTTIFHPVGTAKMGPARDPMAVTNETLQVRGIGALRIIDASVMPLITSGNTNTPTIMIAAKGAAMIA
ncbi:MAG TPA: GMC family oxidoreductase N-terminal domain-containing protein [Hyphomonas sp.]|nr:GMC family oxidoreductase N-terminal domain-containing protein [Hyphomonas sp.]HRK66561.1 GMC family oxidoreductase N-terminal domain-containing protein [Hyphomonas sp.]